MAHGPLRVLFRFLVVSSLLTPVVLAAQPLGSVRGVVVDDYGTPLGGVSVEAVSVSGYLSVEVTDASGGYAFTELVPGTYGFTFSRDRYRVVERSVDVRPRAFVDDAVTLSALVPAGLAGQVVDSQGLALPGALVEAGSPGLPPLVEVTDEAGRFAFSPVRPGTWQVSAVMPGFHGEDATVDVAFSERALVSVSLALDYSLAEEVVVVGSRRSTEHRTVLDSSVPVDVLGADDLAAQPRAAIGEVLRTLVPSFNVATHPISDAATLVPPISLRNLAHDHMLVLVNGKRRHRSSVIAWFAGVTDGAQGPDISPIPTVALRQAEVLRDGASAQYGSDAIDALFRCLCGTAAPS